MCCVYVCVAIGWVDVMARIGLFVCWGPRSIMVVVALQVSYLQGRWGLFGLIPASQRWPPFGVCSGPHLQLVRASTGWSQHHARVSTGRVGLCRIIPIIAAGCDGTQLARKCVPDVGASGLPLLMGFALFRARVCTRMLGYPWFMQETIPCAFLHAAGAPDTLVG